MKPENSLVAHIPQPKDIFFQVPWNRLSNKSQTTLRWTMARAGINFEPYVDGFDFDLLIQLTREDLQDTRNVGSKRAQELFDELEEIFSKPLEIKVPGRLIFTDESTVLENALDTSLNILAYISVEQDVSVYQARIAKNIVSTEQSLREALIDFQRQKQHGWFVFKKKSDLEIKLLEIVQSQLRLPYVMARNLYPELDLRSKIIAGNLGLLGAIKSFDLKSSTNFLTYAETIIEDFIENLVFLGNLEYETLEGMLLQGVSHSSLQIEKVEKKISTIKLDADMAEVLEFIDTKFRENPKIDERTLSILKERLPIFANVPKTLEAIAQEWNVTRERIRQITVKRGGLKLQEPLNIECLNTAVDCLCESKDEEEFMERIEKLPAVGEIPLSANRLRAICEFFALPELVNRVDAIIYKWEHIFEVEGEFRQEIKKLRSPIGLYDLTFLKGRFDVSRDEIEKSISSIYPRTVIKGNLALARTKNLETMFENSVAKQLLVASNLNVDEIIIGLERTASYRGVPLIGATDDLRQLVIFLAGNSPSYNTMLPNMIKPVALQRIETWLVEVFSQSAGSILHSNELVSRALKDDINVSSLQVYLINSPIIRSHSGSIYSLIGSEVDSDNIEMYRKAVLASSKASEIDFSISAQGIELKIRPNLNVITSGIIFPPSGLKQMVVGYVFDSHCDCGKLISRQQVKFTPSGFWTGFTAMIRHGMSEHNMVKESEFIFTFDFEKSSVVLQVN